MPTFSKTINPVFLWLVIVVLSGTEFRQNQWECLLIMFAALEQVPKGLRLLGLMGYEAMMGLSQKSYNHSITS